MPQASSDTPPPLTPPQRNLFWLTALLVVATRAFALASSPWDWDEVQFMAGVREFDVTLHHPHPAGFPLYILLGKLIAHFGASDFRALQIVTFLAACSLFPLAFFLARELRFEFRTSMLAALLFVFFPNIWYFGGTAFSDVTGVAITLAAIVTLLRGRRGAGAFLIGCALVGCALSIRPHAGFILLPPLLIATWHHRRAFGRIVAGAVITATIAVAMYAGAAFASKSPRAYVESVRHFQKWVHEIDSIANPGRTPLPKAAEDFLVKPMGAGRLSMLVTALAILGLALARKRSGPWIALVTFAPYMLFAWLMHDPLGFRRYSTAYVVVYALLAAFALERLTAWLPRAAAVAHIAIVALFIARYVHWTLPAIQEVRTTIAPTDGAATYVKALVSEGERVWIDDSMMPWATYYLAGRQLARVDSPAELPAGGQEWFLTEGVMLEPEAHIFRRARGRVAEIHPERHFEVSVAPVGATWRFAEGWGDPEGHLGRNWRWMSSRSVALIPARPGRARLTLTLAPPKSIAPQIEVRVNGTLLERFPLTGEIEKNWVVDDGRALNRLEITSSATINPRAIGGSDDRELGAQLFAYGWQSLP